MLSQENINKLCMTGIYKSSPNKFYKNTYKDPYHCRNWTFRVRQDSFGEYCMDDTYWSLSPNSISLMDSNFDKFEFLFDMKDVEEYKGKHITDYAEEDCWMHIPIDSGGRNFPKDFIKKGAMPIKERVLERLREELANYERLAEYKRLDIEHVEKDMIDLRWV